MKLKVPQDQNLNIILQYSCHAKAELSTCPTAKVFDQLQERESHIFPIK